MWMWIVEFHILSSWTIAGLKVMNLLLICGRWKKAHLGNTWLCKHIRQLTVMRGKWRFAVLLFFLISFLCSTLHSQLTKLGEPCSGIMVPAAEVLVPWKCLIIVLCLQQSSLNISYFCQGLADTEQWSVSVNTQYLIQPISLTVSEHKVKKFCRRTSNDPSVIHLMIVTQYLNPWMLWESADFGIPCCRML